MKKVLKIIQNIKYMELVLLVIHMIPGILPQSSCSNKICLRWTSHQGVLKFICKVDDLYLPVSIFNNFNREIARCSIPFPSPYCTSASNDTIVHQNVNTSETTVLVRERINHNFNGNWSCHHGRTINKADIEINIQTLKEQTTPTEKDDFRCMKKIALYTMTGVVISVVMFSIFLFLKCKCTEKKKHFNIFNRLASFSKKIDTCFELKISKRYSVYNIKIVFFITFVLLVLIAGFLIGVFEKDSCSGSFVFVIFGMMICLAHVILFIRIRDGNGSENHFEVQAGNAEITVMVGSEEDANSSAEDI